MQDTTALLVKAIRYDHPAELPILVGALPAAMHRHGDALRDLFARYPCFFGDYWLAYDYEKNLPITYRYGRFVDAWGCVWDNRAEGMESYVTGHPVPTRDDIHTLVAPATDEGLPHGFMYLRLLDLRGFDEAMIDFAEEPPELQTLIDIVADYNIRQMEIICRNTPGPIVMVGDDLGMQRGLAIGPEKWRRYLAPAFERIYAVAHAHGKLLYMHTDGDITDILPDLHALGVDMVNPQFRANGLDNLVRLCKGKIPICLDLDRQLFPFATPDELRAHMREAVKRLYLPEGGLALNIEIGPDVPLSNVEALLDEASRLRHYRA